MRLIALVTVLLGMGGLGLAGAAPASAATPPWWYVPNGCTAPNIGPAIYYNALFRSACNRHDICYDYVENRNGEAGRLRCDNRFLADMNAKCGSNGVCRTVARTYYNAVRTFGGPFFNNPWLN